MSRKPESENEREDHEKEPGVSATELLGLILPLLRDFVPIFLEKLSEAADRPTMRGLEEENRRLQDRLNVLDRRMQWLAMFQVVQALFFLFFVVLVALKVF